MDGRGTRRDRSSSGSSCNGGRELLSAEIKKPKMNGSNGNYFDVLQQVDAPDAESIKKPTKTVCQSPVNIPPIRFIELKLEEVAELAKTIITNDENFHLKLSHLKTADLYVYTIHEYNAIKKCCDDNHIKYTTHPLYSTVRFVIHNLPKTTDKEIISNSLAIHKIEVQDVKLLQTKKPAKNAFNGIFVLTFLKKDKVSLEKLREIRCIN